MGKDCRLKVELSQSEPRETIYKFILSENGEKVGWCRTKWDKTGVTEINYEIYNKYRGCGYSIEGIRSVMDMLKNNKSVVKLVAKVNEKNIGAWRVLEKSGFNLQRVFLNKDENTMARVYIYDIPA